MAALKMKTHRPPTVTGRTPLAAADCQLTRIVNGALVAAARPGISATIGATTSYTPSGVPGSRDTGETLVD